LRTTLTLRPRRPLRTSLALVARRAIHAVNAIFTARTPRAALTLRAALTALTLRPWRTWLPRRTCREHARRATHLLHLARKFLRRRVILVGQLVQLGALSLATPHIPRHTQHDQRDSRPDQTMPVPVNRPFGGPLFNSRHRPYPRPLGAPTAARTLWGLRWQSLTPLRPSYAQRPHALAATASSLR